MARSGTFICNLPSTILLCPTIRQATNSAGSSTVQPRDRNGLVINFERLVSRADALPYNDRPHNQHVRSSECRNLSIDPVTIRSRLVSPLLPRPHLTPSRLLDSVCNLDTDMKASSTCTECCIFQFSESNCDQSLLWDGIVRDPACNTLMIGMDHAWISECTGAFVSCTLYNSTDCTGDLSMTIDNGADVCHAPGFFIKSFDCTTD